ncbi:hypothetical protein [Actinomyces bovis]|uniref:hypothetical protein n=1 Tax=Actinomyces bovis TaxID=1658 RepID=UPI000F8449CD|nr:hypothetical protein [Actinomyces bovis]
MQGLVSQINVRELQSAAFRATFLNCLERLAGLDIHNAQRIEPRWQHLKTGDQVFLAPEVALGVARMEPDHCLVLSSEGGQTAPAATMDFDFSWAFVLAPSAETGCRLLVRERYQPRSRLAAASVWAARPVARLMSHGMLRGLCQRAENPQ